MFNLLGKALGPIGAAIDLFTPIKMREDPYDRITRNKSKLADTARKTLNVSNPESYKRGDAVKEARAERIKNTMGIDGDKGILVTDKGARQLKDLTIGDIGGEVDSSKNPKTPEEWRQRRADNIKNLGIKDKEYLSKVKSKYGEALKLGKIPIDIMFSKMKKHPALAGVAGLIGLGGLSEYMFGDDEDDNKATTSQEVDKSNSNTINEQKKDLGITDNKQLKEKQIYKIDAKHLSSGKLPHKIISDTLGVNWKDNRDKIDDVFKKSGVNLDDVGEKGSAERNIALSNLVLTLSKNKEALSELQKYLKGNDDDGEDGFSL